MKNEDDEDNNEVLEILLRSRKFTERVAELVRDLEAELPNCRERSVAITHFQTGGLWIASWGATEAAKKEGSPR